MSRKISTDGLAIRYALACSIPVLRVAAERHIRALIRQHHGQAGDIADAIGVDRRTYERLRVDYPPLAQAHEKARETGSSKNRT